MPSRIILIVLPVMVALAATACGPKKSEPRSGKLAMLVGRAVLPADTFLPDGPPVGAHLEPVINGRELPFGSVPVQGFSSLVPREAHCTPQGTPRRTRPRDRGGS